LPSSSGNEVELPDDAPLSDEEGAHPIKRAKQAAEVSVAKKFLNIITLKYQLLVLADGY
jgi:hypothetical protein